MKSIPLLMPKQMQVLRVLGENIQFARLRRKMPAIQLAARASISRKTLYNIEQGVASVAIGHYLQVLFVLGLEKDFLLVAANDSLGRKLQDAGIQPAKRAPKRSSDEAR